MQHGSAARRHSNHLEVIEHSGDARLERHFVARDDGIEACRLAHALAAPVLELVSTRAAEVMHVAEVVPRHHHVAEAAVGHVEH